MKAGDIVQLKSGGPAMTIEQVHDYGDSDQPDVHARCVWMSKDHKRQSENFAIAALKPYEPPKMQFSSGSVSRI